MKKYINSMVVLVILMSILLFAGCGKTTTTNNGNNSENKNYKTIEQVKKDTSEQENNTKNNTVEKKSKDIKNNKISSDIKKKEEVKKENTKKEQVKKDISKLNKSNLKNKNIEDNSFTLIIAKDLKGYTGKSSEVLVKKKINICDKKNAMTYLRENSIVRDKGGFIYEVNGIHNIYPIPKSKKTEEQKKLKILGIDWFIYLNGKKTSVGANDVYPKKGDELLFDIHEWDKRELSDSAY